MRSMRLFFIGIP